MDTRYRLMDLAAWLSVLLGASSWLRVSLYAAPLALISSLAGIGLGIFALVELKNERKSVAGLFAVGGLVLSSLRLLVILYAKMIS